VGLFSVQTSDVRPGSARAGARAGFTLTEILVSLAIVAVLIGILLPSLAVVRSTSQKVVCAANLRQTGLGLHMYANDNADFLPMSSFAMGNGEDFGTSPLQLRIDATLRGNTEGPAFWWDGLGALFEQRYLSDGRIFYCPSHIGENTFETYADQYAGEAGDILANYQYRGVGPRGEEKLDQFESNAALVADGFRDLSEINHPNGMNVLRAAMSVNWFRDEGLNGISNAILSGAGDEFDWEDRWRLLDEPEVGGGFWFWD
jgi:prepilin-type N-terminal cleavage/methylation domain-containing protein